MKPIWDYRYKLRISRLMASVSVEEAQPGERGNLR
jgi:hypothetical protein